MRPLSVFSLTALAELAARPQPRMAYNPGVVRRLVRGSLAEPVDLPSPYPTHNRRPLPHLTITPAGRRVLAAGPTLQNRPIEETSMVETTGAAIGAKSRSIVVADRGHVWVGHVTERGPDWVKIEGARVIRRWGTTDGLNQLAAEGPRPNTRLDAPADLDVRAGAVIAIIPCEAAKWAD